MPEKPEGAMNNPETLATLGTIHRGKEKFEDIKGVIRIRKSKNLKIEQHEPH